ncbi:bifunctional DNA-formamidopyrimidine glycosylase/DNA-(apurinic or apyrimidinic site) lyase [Nonomuraea sp. 3-1Str]|uniref:bifunctional DNA-formamidopyrimidine glycosylase/DNA-(apurinic or apyrimidinic site) lyase n=1 Tax=unclassified Nonomuraea TaxID=2593643 RepID=UPI0028636132|nr:bifunctional DNA-formamidopyrimidine glycosylase/DNA-(apurinic or apyrimidinic site) lyase [Nonomuraea sp. 3-1Str]MDR8409098.1 bifunctional DNA-formamidopyrimidine glycosylase/DNA-(apurinic or apyrimidinic site) lyase [Nonomuraea sp. 3-1Str]
MPELPEVEVVRRGLAQWVAGREIAWAEVLHPRAVRRHVPGAEEFAARLKGRVVLSAERRGKYLWLPLSGAEEALLAHLGMSGQLLVVEPDSPPEKHLRVRLAFQDGGPELRFVDQRTFGHVMLTPLEGGVPAPISHIAPDPFEEAFDDDRFAAALRRKDTEIKRALLDQTLISGVGNIYADEALWLARLHWAHPTRTLTRPKIAELLAAVREVMTAALRQGGTSFDSLYVNVNGESGYFERSLEAYGRRDRPCSRCGSPIVRDAFMNRSSFSCPTCQRRPRRPVTAPRRAT